MREEGAFDMEQGDDRLHGRTKMMTNVAMMPPTLMEGLLSARYKTKKSDCTLNGNTLEIEILSQCCDP